MASFTTIVSTLRFLIEKGDEIPLLIMINRILQSLALKMKVIKLVEGSFHVFHMKLPLLCDPLFFAFCDH